MPRSFLPRCAALLLVTVLAGVLPAQEKDKEPPAELIPVPPAEQLTVPPREIVYPKADEVNALLKQEPLTLDSWPVWRKRLLEWIDDAGTGTDPAFTAGRKFAKDQAGVKNELPPALAKDHLAWYLLGSWHVNDAGDKVTLELAQAAEQALRRSLALNDKSPHAHRKLALALLHQEQLEPGRDEEKISPRFRDAISAIQEAARLDPQLSVADEKAFAGQIAGEQERPTLADILLLQALGEKPALAPQVLTRAGVAVLLNRQRDFANTEVVLAELAKQFPNDGSIRCLLGVAQLANYNLDGGASLAQGRALGADPEKVVPASSVLTAGLAVLSNRSHTYPQADDVLQVLSGEFPRNAQVPVQRALALAASDNMQAAAQQLELSRSLGGNPNEIGAQIAPVLRIPTDWVHSIQTGAVRERYLGTFKQALLGVASVYGMVVLLMLLAGPLLGKKLAAPAAVSTALVPPVPSGGYRVALLGGLGLFYVLALLIFALLVAAGASLLFLLLNSPQMDFKYLCALIVVGILAWVYISMLFSPRARERVGVVAGKLDSPRFRQVLDEVAQKAEAEPVREVRLAPGTAVGLRLNSWGPLGLFGRQPVLILGMTTLRLLNVGELRALLAQQCVQFSQREAGSGRRIYHGLLRVNDGMADIWHAAGSANYFNPFYLIFTIYHKAYAAMAAGFGQARALAADRAAAQLEGAAALESALEKTLIDAPLLHGKVRQLAQELVVDAPDLSNIYAAWDELCGPGRAPDEKDYAHLVVSAEQLAQERQQVRTKPGCSRAERLAQLATLPRGDGPNATPAVELFDNLEALEEQLTEIITAPLLAGRPQRQGAGAAR